MKIDISSGKKDLWKGGSFLVYMDGDPIAAFPNINSANAYKAVLEKIANDELFLKKYNAVNEHRDWKKESGLWRHWKYGVKNLSEAYELLED